MRFSDTPDSVQSFRRATVENKPLNLPQMTICRFCGKQEYRGCMKLNRCRECYGSPA